MVMKFKLQTIITALLCSVMLLGCSNLIEDLKDKENPAPVVPVPAAADPYLTFKGNGEFTLGCEMNKIKVPGSWDGTVEYSTDKTNWTEWDGWAPIPAAAANGNYFIYLRGKNTTFSKSIMEVTGLLINGSATEVECTGNIMTLLDWENPSSATMGDRCFDTFFSYCTKLTKTPDLPATTLSVGCYCGMFLGCTSLKTAPELPAVTLANNCYDSMFQDCTSLTEAPELPVENLSDNCYRYMFYNCTSLVNTPALPAAELTNRCYEYMFSGCTGLKSIGKIGKGNTVNVTAESAMDNMFSDCTELKIVETTDTDENRFISIGSITGTNAVNDMFNNCASGSVVTPEAGKSYKIETPYLIFKGNGAFSLGNKGVKGWNGTVEYSTDKTTWTEWDGATAIPAVVASNGSYYVYLRGKNNTYISSWSNKTILNFTGDATSVECNGNIMTLLDWENPDTATMDELCFVKLFSSCEKLTKAPDLPSMNLSDACYYQMFEECTALVTAPKLPATTLTESCYYYMFIHCTSLEASPELPATTVIDSCYSLMFAECTSLSSIGKISAKVIDKNFAMQDMFYECSNITVVETTNPDEAFLTIESVDGALTVDKMFYGTKGSVETPVAGKSYKVASDSDSSVTYNIDWRTTKIASLNKTPYELATGASKIVFGKTSDYSAITSDSAYAKYNIGETDNDAVYAYYKSAAPVELYVLADGEIKFEDDDIEHSLEIPYAGPFNSCSEAECIVLKNIDTSELTKSTRFFVFDSKLKTLDISGLDTKNSTSMEMMFYGCLSLETLDLSVLDTSSVTSMKQMFANCNEIKELDLSGFSFDNVVDTSMMFDFFSTTNKLQTIYVKEGTDLSTMASITSSEDMFKNCTSLYGANGTSLDEEHNDKSYARIDTAGTPGYFTKKGDSPYVIPTGTADFSFTLTSGSEINVTKAENVLTADEGYTDYTWYVDTVKKTRATTNTFDLDVAGLTKSGTYNITLEAKKNGEVYSSSMFVKYVAVLPEHFVKVTGGLITGSDDNQCWTSNYRGAFVADRKVKLSNFIICDHEVTKADYKAIMNDSTLNTAGITADPSYTTNQPAKYVIADGEDDEKRPVENVSWYDAVYYCNLLSQIKGLDCVYEITDITTSESTISNAGTSGKETVTIKYISSATVTADHTKNGYRLLTEAEWEYAARGGNPSVAAWKYEYAGAYSTKTSVPYTTDDFLGSVGWYNYNSNNTGTTTSSPDSEGTKGHSTHQVELKSGNALGIYDMSGNVWEWCYDGYDSSVTSNDSVYTQYGKVVDPVGAASVSNRVIRGGCWANDARSTSVGHRSPKTPGSLSNGVGFRICRTDN